MLLDPIIVFLLDPMIVFLLDPMIVFLSFSIKVTAEESRY